MDRKLVRMHRKYYINISDEMNMMYWIIFKGSFVNNKKKKYPELEGVASISCISSVILCSLYYDAFFSRREFFFLKNFYGQNCHC